MTDTTTTRDFGPLNELRVIDMATVVAGPAATRYLADFGADVIKVEPPGGDSTRRLGWGHPDDDSFFWKILARNKRCTTIDLKTDSGLTRMWELVESADVLVENLRPGTLERLGLGPDLLLDRNPGLVVIRITGFGQDGPYASRPGFATLAEALSGYAAINGEPDGGPLLPPIAITDEVTGIVAAFCALAGVHHARRRGRGQVIDVNLVETLFQLMGPLPAAYAHQGYLQPRMGSGLPWSVPRGTYRCRDGSWVALSASAESVAQRVLELLDIADDPRFQTAHARMENREALEECVRKWVAVRDRDEVLTAFEKNDAAVAPVYTMADIFADPHFAARETIVEVDGVAMQNVVARFSETPGRITHAGRPLDADRDASFDGD